MECSLWTIFLVDYCDEPRPPPSKTLFSCDFESSCTEQLISLSNYPYQWSVVQAKDGKRKERDAPAVDYTFANESGHYIWLNNYDLIDKGRVGYLAMRNSVDINSNESFCLNFYYYLYGRARSSHLFIYSWTNDTSNEIQMIWPNQNSQSFTYIKDRWSWAIVNLPIGSYTIMFRMDSDDIIQSSFALDNIQISSCSYPPRELSSYDSILSFSCNFDDLTMCNMENTDDFTSPSFNFTVETGETIPRKDLGPVYDHTRNSSTGGFIYWNQQVPFRSGDTGFIRPWKKIEQNYGMCIQFAYYVKSSVMNKNGTQLILRAGGCYGKEMWIQLLDDSFGWKIVKIPVERFACMENFYFRVRQIEPVQVSIAFDDIRIAQCSSFDPTTTTTTTSSTTTATTTTPAMTTTAITQITTTSAITTTSTTQTTSFSSTSSETTTPTSNALQLVSIQNIYLISLCIFQIMS
ncbi:unnamed protein product [Adineta ricciae]|uniref:MAM domain-containing protein n=1 Tax=Adineta ricciae TaxID=249248 RepID=A0A816CPY7_ADIRI|nr:unnamed protein product [Adineta ricciae]